MSESKPNIASVISPLLADVCEADRPFVIAYVERVAAGRYRVWASQVDDSGQRRRLIACAAREEAIAERVEALSGDAAEIQRAFAEAHPGLQAAYDGLFSGLSIAEQMQVQANAERLGAATWRALAAAADGHAREVFASCAPLEEESAETLEALITRGV